MKKLALGSGVFLLAALIWYLFVKPYDYLVRIKLPGSPGTINQSVKLWSASLENAEILEADPFPDLSQRLQFNDSVHRYQWEIKATSDSTSRIRVFISDEKHSLKNRLMIPFGDTAFEKRSRKTLSAFHKQIREHLQEFKVRVAGEARIDSTYCAFVQIKSTQIEKAKGMMLHYPLLATILVENKVRLNGKPFLEVTYWNRENDSIHYNFCYPIIRSDSLPQHPELKYKQFPSTPAIMAVYNGNYITSDRAWYELLSYAENRNMEVSGLPVERFFSNPNMGGDALNWKAEIFMPLSPDTNSPD